MLVLLLALFVTRFLYLLITLTSGCGILLGNLLVGDSMYLFAWFLRLLTAIKSHLLNIVIGYHMLMRYKMQRSRWFISDIGVLLFAMLIVLTSILCDQYRVILIGYGDGAKSLRTPIFLHYIKNRN